MKVELKDSSGNVKQYTFNLLIYYFKGDVDNYHKLKPRPSKGNDTVEGEGGGLEQLETESSKKRNLTARITDIDEYGMVTIMFNHKLDNSMFNITNSTETHRRNRFL